MKPKRGNWHSWGTSQDLSPCIGPMFVLTNRAILSQVGVLCKGLLSHHMPPVRLSSFQYANLAQLYTQQGAFPMSHVLIYRNLYRYVNSSEREVKTGLGKSSNKYSIVKFSELYKNIKISFSHLAKNKFLGLCNIPLDPLYFLAPSKIISKLGLMLGNFRPDFEIFLCVVRAFFSNSFEQSEGKSHDFQ